MNNNFKYEAKNLQKQLKISYKKNLEVIENILNEKEKINKVINSLNYFNKFEKCPNCNLFFENNSCLNCQIKSSKINVVESFINYLILKNDDKFSRSKFFLLRSNNILNPLMEAEIKKDISKINNYEKINFVVNESFENDILIKLVEKQNKNSTIKKEEYNFDINNFYY